MSISQTLWKEGLPILEGIYKHPFIQELTSGTLDYKKFVFYLQQDWMYLNEFSEALLGASLLASRSSDVASLIKFSKEVQICEQELHLSFFKKYKVKKSTALTPACFHYTNFLRAEVARGNYARSLAALLPCFWVYREVGRFILKHTHSSNPFIDWIATYGSKEFSESVDEMIGLVDHLPLSVIKSEKKNLVHIYKMSTYFEWQFWEDAYHNHVLSSDPKKVKKWDAVIV